jgi:hypothetical protein
MELVRYRPGEAIRWLKVGAESARQTAGQRGRDAVAPDVRDFKTQFKGIANAAADYGRGAYNDMVHRQASANEYVLQDEKFDILQGKKLESIEYARVKAIQFRQDRASVVLDKGAIVIKPFAFIQAGRAKVPVGWLRNGIEVPFELLIEELAARCNVAMERN